MEKVTLPGGWTKHAPKGGITINGKFFKGGTFIPNEDLEKMTPEEKQELDHKLELSQKYGANASKVLNAEKAQETAKKVEAAQKQKETGINENVYIIDDGRILGEQKYGSLVIKKGVALPDDLKILSALNSHRLDVINPTTRTVNSYTSSGGTWPNDFSQLTPTQTDIDSYDLLNNLSPGIKQYFLMNPINMSLVRIRKLSLRNETWLAEKNKQRRVYKLCNKEQTKKALLANAIYRLHCAEVPNIDEEEDGYSTEMLDSSPCDFNDKEKMRSFLAHALLDILLGNKDVLGENNHHVISLSNRPVRTQFNISENEEPMELELFTKFEPYKSVYGQLTNDILKKQLESIKLSLTPNSLAILFNNIGYSNENLKKNLLKRLYNIEKALENGI